jgi:hypothetical protein
MTLYKIIIIKILFLNDDFQKLLDQPVTGCAMINDIAL